MNHFARQMILPEVGAEGQARLAGAHVLVVGAGGLGCPVLQYLAGAGVGQITLIDPDQVEESNLHRQPLFRMADLGRPKVQAARDHLLAANPGLSLQAHACALDPANAPGLVAVCDLVIDAADSFAVSYTLSDLCRDAGKPLISASVLGQAGYVGGFCGTAPSLRAVFPDLPDSAASCATAGVMGPVVGMLGAMQAQMGLQVLLGHIPSPLGQLVSVDMKTLNFGGFGFQDAQEPEGYFPFLSRGDLCAADQVIELRERDEAPVPVCPQALRLTPEDVGGLPETDRRIVLCCRSGLRAWRAATRLQGRGYRDLALLAVGDTA